MALPDLIPVEDQSGPPERSGVSIGVSLSGSHDSGSSPADR